jgi:gamma-glutamyltranspeptidase/glutathione hydrolase
VRRRGGVLVSEDLARSKALVTTPLSIRVGNATVWSSTSPGGGWTELQMLGLLARLDGMLDDPGPFDFRTFVEASRRCYADRFHFMGDPDHVDVPLDVLLGDDYLDALAAEVVAAIAGDPAGRLDYPETLPWHDYARRVPDAFPRLRPDLVPTPWEDPERIGAGLNESFETTHLSTVDEDGMAVSCTLTAGNTFGSRVVADGVLLDDAMIWFNAAPGAANSIAPWKRPLCNMGPLIIRDDDGRMLAVGAPGGRRITSAIAQVAAHWLRGDDVERATGRPRIDGSGGAVLIPSRASVSGL